MKNKYFYPIFKLKAKSWIRYWLLKKTEFKGKLSEILEGSSFTLNNTLSMKFNLFEIYGNSIQDGEPSPDNEVPILSSGDNGSITEKIENKNLFNYPNNKITLTATRDDFTTYLNNYKFTLKANKTYVISMKTDGTWGSIAGTDTVEAFLQNLDTGAHTRILSPNGFSITPSVDTTYKFRLDVNKNGKTHSFWDIQVEEGLTATPYVPHKEQTYTIPVQQPMRSIGDVRDCFVKKSDGWYERHYIGEVILNSSENIARELISNNVYKFYINNIENVDYGDVNYVPKILCNKLIAVARTPMYLNTQGISSGNGNLQIYTDETKNMTVSEFKTWLENNNLIVNYLKTIPIDLPCTEEQIEILENPPKTYAGQTNINSPDEVKPFLKIQYWESDTNG